MKKVFLTCCILILYFIQYSTFAQDKIFFNQTNTDTLIKSNKLNSFSYGIKGGIGFWKMMGLKGTYSLGYPPEYSYPIGFSIGIFIENKLSKQLSIINELSFQSSNTTAIIHNTGYEGVPEQQVNMQNLNLSFLFNYRTLWLNTFVFFGPSVGYLMNATYKSFDHVYSTTYNANITKGLPNFNASLEFGLGYENDIYNSHIMLELRGQLGLTKYQYKETNGINIGEWKNSGLIFLLGVQL